MIKKTTLLLALIIAPALCGMDVAQTYESRRRAVTKTWLLGTHPQITTAEYKTLLEDKIIQLEAAQAEAKKAPRALDNLELINHYTRQIIRLYECLAILNNVSQTEMPQRLRDFKRPDELEKSERRLEQHLDAQPDSFLYENPTAIRKWRSEQRWAAYQIKNGDLKRKPFSQTERELSAAILSGDPEADTKITARIQALEELLVETTDHKQETRLRDELSWAKAQQKINVRMAKK